MYLILSSGGKHGPPIKIQKRHDIHINFHIKGSHVEAQGWLASCTQLCGWNLNESLQRHCLVWLEEGSQEETCELVGGRHCGCSGQGTSECKSTLVTLRAMSLT